jgi:hypothetical protein
VGLEECALCSVLGVLRVRCWVSLVHRIGCPASVVFGMATDALFDTLLPRLDWKIYIVYILCIYIYKLERYMLYIYTNMFILLCIHI